MFWDSFIIFFKKKVITDYHYYNLYHVLYIINRPWLVLSIVYD